MTFLKITILIRTVMYFPNQTTKLISRKIVMAVMIFFTVIFSAFPVMAEKLNTAEQNDSAPDFTRSTVNYDIPNVEVIRKDGKKLSFIKEMDDGRPVIMNFIFASCSAICPMLSHVFSQVQTKLGKDSQKVHLMSFSIDPENDTPAKLSEYAKKFGAGQQWDYYTGSINSSIAIQKAFNVYRGDKMNHASVILMRTTLGKPWLRLEGFMSPDAVIREYHSLN
jgi:protein SCO1